MMTESTTGRIVNRTADALEILKQTRRIAVIGIKPEVKAAAPAHFVPAYLKRVGYEIIPVPCYYPDVQEILGQKVYRSVAEVPGDVDLVVVFRRPEHIPPHVDDIIAKHPKAVWFQLGIRNDEAAERLAAAGIDVVQNRCTMVDHRMLRRAGS
jgi:predicted CoA-binding protein